MSDELTARLNSIQERAANCLTYNFGLRVADMLAHSDVPFLLELARKQQAALDAVRVLHAPRDFDPVTDGVYFGQTNMDYEICHHDAELYPCTTIAALEAKP